MAEEALHGVVLGGIGGEGEGFAAGQFEELFIAQGIGDMEAQIAGLAGAEKFAGAAEEAPFPKFRLSSPVGHLFDTASYQAVVAKRKNPAASPVL